MKRLWMILLAAVLLLGACGSNSDKQRADDNKEAIQVKTTVYPLAYFAQRIGGDAVEASSIYPPGADSHTFEPTQKDMMALADSDLFIYIGLGLEGFVDKAEKTLKNENVRLVPAGASIPENMLRHGEAHHDEEAGHESHDHSGIDPHVWLSPVLADRLAESVKDALVKERPDLEATFTERYDALSGELKKLDGEYREMADAANVKTFYISHASFGYVADEYGLKQVSVAGLNSQSEPSQKQLAHIVDQARDENIRYIFFEQNVSSKLSEVIRKEIGAEPLLLHNLSVLTADDVKNGETYFSLMERNLDRFKTALGQKTE
ncbi:metal ABC transporter solute-binding protein, Zn/Mn family [Bhargavaea ullalensis]|uniref:Zinc transport system substrate-binding protein n=1 Tax=Bhargavaea ullalensis TaxID=1265685 RepID=A0ABV2GAN2_9BACL